MNPFFLLLASIFFTHTLAQISATISIYNNGDFRNQRSCAFGCFVYGNNDLVALAIGCQKTNIPIVNDCYCRADLQPPAISYVANCVSTACSNTVDVNNAVSIYTAYCATADETFVFTLASTTQTTARPSTTQPSTTQLPSTSISSTTSTNSRVAITTGPTLATGTSTQALGTTVVVTDGSTIMTDGSTAVPSSTNSSQSGSSPNVPNVPNMVGIGVGVGIGVFACCASLAGLYFWLRRRNGRKANSAGNPPSYSS